MDETLVFDDQLLESSNKKGAEKIKKKTETFWASSRGRISLVWTFSLTGIAVMYLMTPSNDERALEITFLVSTLIGKYNTRASSFNFISRDDKEYFVGRFPRVSYVYPDPICKPR